MKTENKYSNYDVRKTANTILSYKILSILYHICDVKSFENLDTNKKIQLFNLIKEHTGSTFNLIDCNTFFNTTEDDVHNSIEEIINTYDVKLRNFKYKKLDSIFNSIEYINFIFNETKVFQNIDVSCEFSISLCTQLISSNSIRRLNPNVLFEIDEKMNVFLDKVFDITKKTNLKNKLIDYAYIIILYSCLSQTINISDFISMLNTNIKQMLIKYKSIKIDIKNNNDITVNKKVINKPSYMDIVNNDFVFATATAATSIEHFSWSNSPVRHFDNDII